VQLHGCARRRRRPRRIRRLIALTTVAALLPAAQAEAGVRVGEDGGGEVVLRVDGARLPVDGQVVVAEDGRRIGDVSVYPAPQTAHAGGVGIVLDAGAGMAGSRAVAATRAARAVVAQRRPGAVVAVVAGATSDTILLPATYDRAAVGSALGAPLATAGHADLGRATTLVVEELRRAGVRSGAVAIVGRSQSAVPAAVVRRARSAGLRVVPVDATALGRPGLRSALAAAAAPAPPAYLVRFRSPSGARAGAEVSLAAPGVTGRVVLEGNGTAGAAASSRHSVTLIAAAAALLLLAAAACVVARRGSRMTTTTRRIGLWAGTGAPAPVEEAAAMEDPGHG
jgi:hypothetical protein